jgi:transposase
MEQLNAREIKGQNIAANMPIRVAGGYFRVPSSSVSGKIYRVHPTFLTCTCPDFTFNKQECKHIIAVNIIAKRTEKITPTPVLPAAPKYTQDWKAYNKSQVTEKARFLAMLSDLTRDVAEPEHTNGRPAIPLGDILFSLVYKVYSQMSARRFTTDLQMARAQGLIEECPHFNSLNRSMAKTDITPLLEALVEVTSKPLTALESTFAVDSTGMSVSNTVSWMQAKHKDTVMMKKKAWLKIHVCVGTRTNVITAVEITDKKSNDALHFIPVVEATRKNFNIKEISADKAYTSAKHMAYAEMNGIDAYLPFKDNTTAPNSGIFSRMFHYFSFNRNEFIQHYNMRSNVETTFHMIKSKFGGLLKSKTFDAQKNECLAKVICHNICVLIQTIDEFGIEI